jgi:AAA ATPase
MKIETQIIHLIQANVKVAQIISYETLRIHAFLIKASKDLSREFYTWNRVEGLKRYRGGNSFEIVEEESSPEEALRFFQENENIILLLEDFFPDLTQDKPTMIRRFRNIAAESSTKKRTLFLSQPFKELPKELEKEVHIIELPYPNIEDIKAIYRKVAYEFGYEEDFPDNELIQSALGLTIMEAERAFSLAFVENKKLTNEEIPLIIQEKENIIKKSGFLEYYHPKETIDTIGGLDNLKEWLIKRGRGFDRGAEDFGLTSPKGILLLGVPGTGKSLTAKAIGNLWKFPLLRLDMGKIFGGIVGESESNIRQALHIAQAIAPSILWIDEIEKGLSGASSSGSTDGGTSARVLGTFLTWMQEKTQPVFVVATANDISQLPPELLRKGRVDEIFFVDLPTEKEREEILKIHLRKKHRKPEKFALSQIAQACQGFSGAEIEEVIKEALFQAYDESVEVTDGHILQAIEKTYPLSKTMGNTIKNLRQWAKSRAVLASSEEAEMIPDTANIPRLKQEEYNNPFL